MLKNHLYKIGLKHFDDFDELSEWGKNLLYKFKVDSLLLNSFNYYLNNMDENNNYLNKRKLYNLAAQDEKLLSFFHSIRFKEILISGQNVIADISNTNTILDLGCNSGYLTSYYAKTYTKINFFGIDNCVSAIDIAKKRFSNIINLKFVKNFESLNCNFDCVIDTQCLTDINNEEVVNKLLKKIHSFLNNKGFLLSIASLKNEDETRRFIYIMKENCFYLNNISPIVFYSFGSKHAFTKLFFLKKPITFKFDVEEYFKILRYIITI